MTSKTKKSTNPTKRYILDILHKECNGTFNQQNILLCRYVFAVSFFCSSSSNNFPDISEFAYEAYLRRDFIAKHNAGLILPSVDFIPMRSIKPHAYKRSVGRPNKKERL